jgi:hypothetical protein
MFNETGWKLGNKNGWKLRNESEQMCFYAEDSSC